MKNVYPGIGIRPVIDGRRNGIRESPEEITMNLAKNVARFYSERSVIPMDGQGGPDCPEEWMWLSALSVLTPELPRHIRFHSQLPYSIGNF